MTADTDRRSANTNHGSHLVGDDPVFAAIERHRRAALALSTAREPTDALIEELSSTEQDAFLAWLTTPPTTMAGVLASLAYAAYRPPNNEYANLAESAQYCRGDGDGDPNDILTAGEQFPAMIAAVLRKIVGS